MQITENLFELTDEQIESSKIIYNGKIIKCLVAPYHTFSQLENIVTFTKNTFLFPERELNIIKLRGFISMIVNNTSTDEFRIITTNQNIIIDMIDTSVRLLTESGDIVESPCKTFLTNIHVIKCELLENKKHQLNKNEITESQKRVRYIVDKLNKKGQNIKRSEYISLLKEIDIIGEPIMKSKLMEMAEENLTILDN